MNGSQEYRNPPKRQKTKTYRFHPEWEEDYFFTAHSNKPTCLICHSSVAVFKKGNIERHFTTRHFYYNNDYPANSETRKHKVLELKEKLLIGSLNRPDGQVQPDGTMVSSTASPGVTANNKPIDKKKAATIASYRISHMLAVKKKSFEDGVLIKKVFLEAADSLFDQFDNKADIMSAIGALQLSGNTVTRRIESMATDVVCQLKSDLESCVCFSLQLDGSTESQLSVFVRMVLEDFSFKEELTKVIPIKETTTGEEIYTTFKHFVTTEAINLQKLVCVTTDGVPTLTSAHDGFVAFCRRDPEFPAFFNYDRIISHQAICEGFANLSGVMNSVVKMVNSFQGETSEKRLFKDLTDELETQYGETLAVDWLSKGKVLPLFRQHLPQIRSYVQQCNGHHEELNESLWLLDLAFLTDLACKLNDLNRELTMEGRQVINLISITRSFTEKLKLWEANLLRKDLKHFPNLGDEIVTQESIIGVFYEMDRHVVVLRQLQSELEWRFTDLEKLEPMVRFIAFPFLVGLDIEEVSESIAINFDVERAQLELEMISFRTDIELRCRSSDRDFWGHVDAVHYPLIRLVAMRIKSLFGTSYMTESSSTNLKVIKNKFRTRITDSNLDNCVRLAVTSYAPNIFKLADEVQCQPSH